MTRRRFLADVIDRKREFSNREETHGSRGDIDREDIEARAVGNRSASCLQAGTDRPEMARFPARRSSTPDGCCE